MLSTILLRQNLAIEPDIQNFIGFVLSSVKNLGGNSFSAVLSTLEATNQLREAGAGSGYPLPVTLALEDDALVLNWEESGRAIITRFKPAPPADAVEQLTQYLRKSTETSDPSVLLKRNAEMMRYLDETRQRTEAEIEEMQKTLAKRQEELLASTRQAETDPLTGLYNRRAYDEKLSRAFNRTLRQKNESLSLILFDLDYFKQINDEYGHQYGDAYLCKMAQAMLGVMRHEVDFAFRFGGDEFAMLLFASKDIAREKGLLVLESMTNKVSIGIASLSAEEPCTGVLENFIHRADDALYQAKRAGRGQVVVDTCHEDGSITWEHFLPKPLQQEPIQEEPIQEKPIEKIA